MIKEKTSKVIKEIKKLSRLCKENHLDSHSAAAAFFIFVSIIPFFILILSVLPYTPLTDESIASAFAFFLPDNMDDFAVSLMKQVTDTSLALISLSALTAVWTSSRSVLTIKRGLNEVHSVTEEGGFIVLRLGSILQMIILVVSVLGILILNVVLTAVDRYFRDVLGIMISKEYSFVHVVFVLKPLITLIIGFLVNLFIFTVLPNKKLSARGQVYGALFTSITWYIFSWLFSFYIDNFNAYSMYGSIAIVIINLVWLYACMYFMFLGAEINYYLSLKRENRKI